MSWRTCSNSQLVPCSHTKTAAPMGSRGFSHSLWQPTRIIKNIILTSYPEPDSLRRICPLKLAVWLLKKLKKLFTSNHANMEQSKKSQWLLSRTVGWWVTSQERRRIISTVKFNSWVVALDRSLKNKHKNKKKISLVIKQWKPLKYEGWIKIRYEIEVKVSPCHN